MSDAVASGKLQTFACTPVTRIIVENGCVRSVETRRGIRSGSTIVRLSEGAKRLVFQSLEQRQKLEKPEGRQDADQITTEYSWSSRIEPNKSFTHLNQQPGSNDQTRYEYCLSNFYSNIKRKQREWV